MTSQKKKVSESLSAEASSSSSFARAPSASNLPSTQHADVTSNDAAAHAAASAKPWERSQSELNLKNKDKSAARGSASAMDYGDCAG